jgi:hypothetical protein
VLSFDSTEREEMVSFSSEQSNCKREIRPTLLDPNMSECNLPTFYLLNATSLAKQNAKEQLLADVKSVQADVVMITETWFTDKQADDDLKIDGFVLFRRDRMKRKGEDYVCM